MREIISKAENNYGAPWIFDKYMKVSARYLFFLGGGGGSQPLPPLSHVRSLPSKEIVISYRDHDLLLLSIQKPSFGKRFCCDFQRSQSICNLIRVVKAECRFNTPIENNKARA
eukprot:m.47317 g.47317  ORF g.47317 m.47317 type:complete len:113 (+) comp7323_c0_seq2:126-464(+)